MPEHTPIPWRRAWAQDGEYTGPGDDPPGYVGDWYETNEIEAGDLESEFPTRIGYADHPPDAEFIVRACNAHEDLLAACEETRRWFEEDTLNDLDELSDDAKAILEMLCAAIARARGDLPPKGDADA